MSSRSGERCQGYTCQRPALSCWHGGTVHWLCVLIIGCSHPMYLWSPMGAWNFWDHLPLLPFSSHINTSFSITETLRPWPTPQIPSLTIHSTRALTWSGGLLRCLPTLFSYALTKHSAPFCHEPDCFHFAPFPPLSLPVPPVIPIAHLVPFPISTLCLLKLLTPILHHCLHSTVSSPVTHSIGYTSISLLPTLLPSLCPSSAHSHTQPFMVFPPIPFHLSTFCCSSPLLCLWVPASLTSDSPYSPSRQIATWAQEAGVQNQPEVADLTPPVSPILLKVTYSGPETQEYFYQQEDEFPFYFFKYKVIYNIVLISA